ncbi:MAG: (5-formylfuran-3-yl)methyl phosphate synthase [Methylotenera sp.]|nr:(5-formylfuran-3-yl)methyl phosphate synthase [Methylotenera sp.]
MSLALASKKKSPQLLISVSTLPEAQIAIDQGADIVDLKDPALGALGALPLDDIKAIVALIKRQPAASRKLCSATLGDLPMQVDRLIPQLKQVLASGVDIVKIGFFPSEDYQVCLDALKPYAQSGHQIIAVLFAETLYPDSLIAAIKHAGLIGIMLDTQHKNGLSLFDHYADKQASAFAQQVLQQGLLLGLAGSLRQNHVAAAKSLQPSYIGFRGGVCHAYHRQSRLDAEKIKVIREML